MRPFTIFFGEYSMEHNSSRQEGEGEILYHVSRSPKLKGGFHPLSHFGTKETARARHNYMDGSESLHAVRIKHGKSFEVHEQGNSPQHVVHHLHKRGLFNKKEHDELQTRIHHHVHRDEEHKANRLIANAIRKKGYQSLHYIDRDPGVKKGHVSHVITHHSQVRVIKQRQNPRKYNDDDYMRWIKKK